MLSKIKLGNILETIIAIVTLGYGLRIAKFVAKTLGYEDCGCETRKQWLNTIFVKKEIKLDEENIPQQLSHMDDIKLNALKANKK